jgi:hypothetical protein
VSHSLSSFSLHNPVKHKLTNDETHSLLCIKCMSIIEHEKFLSLDIAEMLGLT